MKKSTILIGLVALGAVALYVYAQRRSPNVSDPVSDFVTKVIGVPLEGQSIQATAQQQGTTAGEVFRGAAGAAVDAVIDAKKKEGVFVSGAGKGVGLTIDTQNRVDESLTSPSKNKEIMIVNELTGHLQTVRDVFRQSPRPTGILAIGNRPAGTISQQSTNPNNQPTYGRDR